MYPEIPVIAMFFIVQLKLVASSHQNNHIIRHTSDSCATGKAGWQPSPVSPLTDLISDATAVKLYAVFYILIRSDTPTEAEVMNSRVILKTVCAHKGRGDCLINLRRR